MVLASTVMRYEKVVWAYSGCPQKCRSSKIIPIISLFDCCVMVIGWIKNRAPLSFSICSAFNSNFWRLGLYPVQFVACGVRFSLIMEAFDSQPCLEFLLVSDLVAISWSTFSPLGMKCLQILAARFPSNVCVFFQ